MLSSKGKRVLWRRGWARGKATKHLKTKTTVPFGGRGQSNREMQPEISAKDGGLIQAAVGAISVWSFCQAKISRSCEKNKRREEN